MSFYTGKKVLITGSTGFKGAWMTQVLLTAGAEVYGYSLKPPTNPSLFDLLFLDRRMNQEYGDVRDFKHLLRFVKSVEPDIVFHLAAQPIVKASYQDPVYTYETNVMGTVSLLECLRQCSHIKSFLNVTSDKVYENKEWVWGYRENDSFGGFDPYSNSKACSELVTQSYRQSFLEQQGIAVSTARAGNVIGFGDFSPDRILPDCFRAVEAGKPLALRSPNAVRPYQHVLEAISGYLLIAQRQFENPEISGCYNVGPDYGDSVTTANLVKLLEEAVGESITLEATTSEPFHESEYLQLDTSKIRRKLRWNPKWNIETAVRKTAEGMLHYQRGGAVNEEVQKQILDYFGKDFAAELRGSEKG